MSMVKWDWTDPWSTKTPNHFPPRKGGLEPQICALVQKAQQSSPFPCPPFVLASVKEAGNSLYLQKTPTSPSSLGAAGAPGEGEEPDLASPCYMWGLPGSSRQKASEYTSQDLGPFLGHWSASQTSEVRVWVPCTPCKSQSHYFRFMISMLPIRIKTWINVRPVEIQRFITTL